MHDFKKRWQIQKNWQLIFPCIGILSVVYTSFKIAMLITKDININLTIGVAVLIAYLFIKLCLFLFKKLEHKWVVNYRWEMIRIFIVFAITGSSSVFVGRPFIKFLGITHENLHPFIYWFLFIFISLTFYQILLVTYGWLLGQFKFFWEFEKKMLVRFGLGFLFEKNS